MNRIEELIAELCPEGVEILGTDPILTAKIEAKLRKQIDDIVADLEGGEA